MTVTSATPATEQDLTDETVPSEAAEQTVLAELLVEDVSIDGMCGVY